MVPVLSLVVAVLAMAIGPLITWAVVRRQIRASAREAWMREFRQHAAELLKNHGLRPGDGKAEFQVWVAMRLSHSAIRLLIAEKAPHYDGFISQLDDIMKYQGGDSEEFTARAAEILRRERAAIMEDQGVWREIWINLGLTRRDPPHFP